MAIRLQGPPKSTVAEDLGAAQKILELAGRRVNLKRDRSNTTKFISRQIELEGQGLSPEIASRQAALEISNEQSDFGGGVLGGLKKFVSGFDPGGQGTFTAPIAEKLLNQPQGLDAAKVKSAIEANQALTASRTGKTAGPTKGQKRRDADIKIVNNDKLTTNQKTEALERLKVSQDLFDIPPEDFTDDLDKFFKDNKQFKIERKGGGKGFIKDDVFGEEGFNKGLEASITEGLKDGINPESMEKAFMVWWDEQVEKEKGQDFQKFADRSTFGGGDISALIEKALQAGNINQEERDSATKIIKADPGKAEDIKKALGL